MQPIAVVRLVCLFIHVIAFAVALGCVLREDAKLISRAPIDPQSLQAASLIVAPALAVLWLSGIALIVIDTAGEIAAILANAKLAAKLVVVTILSLNGFALHMIAFPALRHPWRPVRRAATVIVLLGTLSAVSWAFATFLGVARGIARALTFEGVITTYAVALAAGYCAGLVLVRPIIEAKMRRRLGQPALVGGTGEPPLRGHA